MQELKHLAADRYQRAGCGGTHKVYSSSKAFDDAKGYREMSPFRRAAYEATMRFRDAAKNAALDFAWDCRRMSLDTVNGQIPF
jgi:hypothetical protein